MTAEGQLADADPLDVARLWIAHAAAIAEEVADHERREPGFGKIHAEIIAAGPRQYDATQRAGYVALVSIAGDLRAMLADVRRIADALTIAPAPGSLVDVEIADDDDGEFRESGPGLRMPHMPPGQAEAAERTRWAAAEGADD